MWQRESETFWQNGVGWRDDVCCNPGSVGCAEMVQVGLVVCGLKERTKGGLGPLRAVFGNMVGENRRVEGDGCHFMRRAVLEVGEDGSDAVRAFEGADESGADELDGRVFEGCGIMEDEHLEGRGVVAGCGLCDVSLQHDSEGSISVHPFMRLVAYLGQD